MTLKPRCRANKFAFSRSGPRGKMPRIMEDTNRVSASQPAENRPSANRPSANRPGRRRGPITLFCESRRFRWSAITVAILVLYVLSAGPYVWLSQYRLIPEWAEAPVDCFYIPFWRLTHQGPDAISDALNWYVELWGSLEPDF